MVLFAKTGEGGKVEKILDAERIICRQASDEDYKLLATGEDGHLDRYLLECKVTLQVGN